MIDDELRHLMPAERRLPPQSKQKLKERVMNEIRSENEQPPRRRRPSRRLVGGLAAAAVLAMSGAAAAAIMSNGPDPEQAAQVIENNAEAAEVHLDGWRPSLRAESVACIDAGSDKLTDPRDTGNTGASEFPLEELLTSERLIGECASGNDWARIQGGFDPSDATVCVRDQDYLLAVVALEGLGCEDAGPDVRPITEDDLQRLNQMRSFEVAMLAIPQECPNLEQATEWARTQLDVHDEPLILRTSDSGEDGCYGAMTLWDTGEVVVEKVSGP